MKQTLRDKEKRKSFWYGHNGITILCDDSELRGSQHKPNAVKLINPQIVNGCQTTTTIKECFSDETARKNQADFPVMGRIIQLDGTEDERKNAAELIADRTNTQAAVNSADLRANDSVQVLFQDILRKYGNGWFYERKQGGWNALDAAGKARFKSKGTAPRLIKRDDYQQAWRSYIGHPADAITKKANVWEANSELYGSVFSDLRRSCDIVLVCTLYDWFARVFTVKRDSRSSLCVDVFYGMNEHLESIQGAKTLVVAHSVALVGHLVQTAYGDVSNYPEKNVALVVNNLHRGPSVKKNWSRSNGKESWRILREAIETVMRVWSTYLLAKNYKEEETLHTLLKNPNTLEELRGIIDSLIPKPPKDMVDPTDIKSS